MSGRLSTILLLSAANLVTGLAPQDLSIPYTHSTRYSSLVRHRAVSQPSSKWLCHHYPRVGQAELYSEFFDNAFLTNMTVGGQDVLVIIDTGSSDTWIVDSTFTCLNITDNEPIPQEDCALVAAYTPGGSFEEIPDENFNITYGDGEFLNGVFGYETVELAGIEVARQQIAVPYLAGWLGDNITSGLTGLAYPALTAAYIGTNVSADNRTDPESRIQYSPIINTIFYVENLTAPIFSISLSRNPNIFGFGGYLTIGGIPDISDPTVNASNNFAVTPIEYYTPRNPDNYLYYLITVENIIYPSSPGPNNTQFIVDSGTTVNFFPTADAEAINALFDPPAIYDDSFGGYIVWCNATPPEVGVTISGQTFYHNPLDLIYNQDLGPELCLSGILDAGDIGIAILGDTFLKNVLAVFDVGNSEMAFASRMYYQGEEGE